MCALCRFDPHRLEAFVCDLTVPGQLGSRVAAASVDCITMVFVASAIAPKELQAALSRLVKLLKPGGCVSG